jgi:hypothetical protein
VAQNTVGQWFVTDALHNKVLARLDRDDPLSSIGRGVIPPMLAVSMRASALLLIDSFTILEACTSRPARDPGIHRASGGFEMEHRLGARIPIHIPIQWNQMNQGLVSVGLITNVSLSGGFVADCDLRLLSHIQIAIDLPLQTVATVIPAYVARRSAAGSGIAWCEWAPPAIARLLRSLPAHSSTLPAPRHFHSRRA